MPVKISTRPGTAGAWSEAKNSAAARTRQRQPKGVRAAPAAEQTSEQQHHDRGTQHQFGQKQRDARVGREAQPSRPSRPLEIDDQSAVEALKGASLSFKSGAMTAILGPSGCGKTTLLRSIAGFIPIDEGRIFFGNDDVTQLPPQHRGTAMVFQNYALWPHMTIFGNVSYGLRLRRCPRPRFAGASSRCWSWSRSGTCPMWKRASPPALSGGQQQRVALGAGPGGGAEGAPDGRAPVQPGRQGAAATPRRTAPASEAGRDHGHLRDARPGRGAGPGGYRGSDESGADHPDGVTARHLPQARTAFAAEFLGVSNQLEGEVADGKLTIAGQAVSYAGPVRGKAVVIIRASDIQIEDPRRRPGRR